MTVQGRWHTYAWVASSLLLAGCASVTVKKVPSPSQYLEWTDKQQKQADAMEGLRFYLPRPFVSVFESFPIRTDIYLANGIVSPDGKYVVVTSVTSESGLSHYIATDPRAVQVPTGFIFDPKVRTQSLAAAAMGAKTLLDAFGVAQALKDVIPTGVVGAAPAPQQPPPPPPPPPLPDVNTGMSQRKMTNDNGAFAYQPLRGNFDIVYLPDFDEQYVISSTAGLGNAMFAINLGQGWSLQGFDSLVDNSELNKRIFNLIDTAMRLAQGAASAALGIPLLGPAAAEPGVIRPQSGQEAMKAEIPGTPVTLKIVVVHYAAKGLYPVIKARELQERSKSQTGTYGVLDLFELFPKLTWASSYDPTAITRAQQAIENETGSYTVPRYPYQYVSFNAFRYMAIEVIRPSDDAHSPFEHLYDKTGTTGQAGDARTGEIDQLLGSVISTLRSLGPEEKNRDAREPDQAERLDRLADGLGALSFSLGELRISVTDATHGGSGAMSLRLKLTGDPGATTMTQLEEELLKKVREYAVKQSYLSRPDSVTAITLLNRDEIEQFLVEIGADERAALDQAASELTDRQPELEVGQARVQVQSVTRDDARLIFELSVTRAIDTAAGAAPVVRSTLEEQVRALAEAAVTEAGGVEGTLREVQVNWEEIAEHLGH